jgi:hypothetical protein
MSLSSNNDLITSNFMTYDKLNKNINQYNESLKNPNKSNSTTTNNAKNTNPFDMIEMNNIVNKNGLFDFGENGSLGGNRIFLNSR